MNKIICWWSGGVTSAVACALALDIFGKENCTVIMIDTRNEDSDTYRFKADWEKAYGKPVHIIDNFSGEYESIEDVWRKYNSLNTANGAICSSELKRTTREKWQKENEYDAQVFGFEMDTKEFKRALSMKLNHSESKPVFPLLMAGYDKKDCIKILQDKGIEVPRMYKLGFKNNNCFQTGCIQGGIGYFQKLHKDFPEKYDAMAAMEHELTNSKGEPVTCLKDQGKESIAKAKELGLKRKYMPLFLKSHPDYPHCNTVLDKPAREVKPLMDCNGFCGVDDLIGRSETEGEINNGK